ncbi:TonB-linked SusC/RagA family outer membrane protein [Maribacter vaceletii]|uniref:TonB-linked SusC/RagA family outer membrane protein n=1 Tax=Maribacter vaceletii TaxID=1206816 RepID=A0A495EBT8_9FLAO|nr:SusC/RagA family TonB-linked outer membrane protein [Maribacter vaceletii]RKR14013.1 TonB-linked SusC/RagA family outer membrane protein [Maribacter vaceletii]
MRTKLNGILTLLLALIAHVTLAQEKTVSGTVSDQDGLPLPGVNIVVQGSTSGTQTDFDGNYSINASEGQTLMFSYIGQKTATAIVGASNTVNIQLQEDAEALEEVVVTAMGMSREKKSLGYAAQEIKGDQVSTVKVDNVVNSLSGKVSGVQIKANNNFGGSSNFLIRGVSSLKGNNQPLFIIDGIPISNRINNTTAQEGGSTGYDYGNAASDINPDDVASINILKGAAASAIYGSRGSNGAIIITTKKGRSGNAKVTVSSGITVGSIDKSTFLEYQDEYGAGYGPYYGINEDSYFQDIDATGDGITDIVVPTFDDGSYGAPLDGSLVYQWDAFVPEHANYQTATPYVAGKNTPVDFFETSYQYNNSVSVAGGNEKMTYRLGYTNFEQKGMLPNSNLNKNTFNLNGTLKVNDKLQVGSNANFIIQRTVGRNSTGYSDNLMSQFRQWWQVNVDVKEQQAIFNETGQNYSWNHEGGFVQGGSALQPHYWDNPYWSRYKNYQNDRRARFYGNLFATYSLTNWLDVTAKGAVDSYDELREERRAVGSVAAPFGLLRDDESSGYDRKDISFREYNYDLMFNVNTAFNDDLTLTGVAGVNLRSETYSFYHQATAGGIIVPELYSLSNSVNAVPKPKETLEKKKVAGYYAQASLGYKNMLYLDLTDRYDVSSSLPSGNNKYNYYAISSSLIFSNLIDASWLNFGKIRGGYAEVGNDLPANNVYDTFTINNNFGSSVIVSYPGTKQNSELIPERTKEIEFGLEARMFNNRVGFDITAYKKNTEDQLMDVSLSTTTGFTRRWVNAGEMENKGIEVGLNFTPVETNNFAWNVNVNWSKNENKVVSLFGGQENLQLNSFQGGISINATVGEAYGSIRGTGFDYHSNGQKIVDANGYYVAKADQVLGNVNPDWLGGVSNTLRYKELSLNFLIDIQKGGDVYSLDTHYGQGTGLPYYTAGLNELGNPKRDPVTSGADSGGVLNPGVTEDGQPNTTRARADYFGGAYYWGNSSRNPAALTVYDASYIKLRELSLKYQMPVDKWLKGKFVSAATISLVGRNLWIIDKNVPFADPESGLGAGNVQGYLSGSYPTLKTVGLNLNLEF